MRYRDEHAAERVAGAVAAGHRRFDIPPAVPAGLMDVVLVQVTWVPCKNALSAHCQAGDGFTTRYLRRVTVAPLPAGKARMAM